MTAADVWAPPTGPRRPGPQGGSRGHSWREDARTSAAIVVVSVLLGAPAGLLWSAVAPHFTVSFDKDGAHFNDIEGTKAFIGADGSYLVVMLCVGLLCGVLAWRFGRRAGPWAVGALVVGGLLAALIAASVGLRPHAHEAVQALNSDTTRGEVNLFLGKRDQKSGELSLRAGWAAVAWPVGALGAFLVGAFRRPEALD